MSDQQPWRVGSHYSIHVYEGQRPVATFHNAEDARLAVDAVNHQLFTAGSPLRNLPPNPDITKMNKLSPGMRRWPEGDPE